LRRPPPGQDMTAGFVSVLLKRCSLAPSSSWSSRFPIPLPAYLRRPVFREMFHFMSVGVVNFCLSLFIYDFSSRALQTAIPDDNLRLSCALAIAFAITVTTAFILNSRITFRERGAGARAYIRYGIVNLVGFGFNVILNLGFCHLIAIMRHETLNAMVTTFIIGKDGAFLAAAGCVFFWNFFMSRHWVFRPRIEITPGPMFPSDGFSDITPGKSERAPIAGEGAG